MSLNNKSNMNAHHRPSEDGSLASKPEPFLVNSGLSSYNAAAMRRTFVSNFRFQLTFGIAMARGVIVGLILPGLMAVLALYLMSQNPELLPEQKTILINGLNQTALSLVGLGGMLVLVNGLFGFLISQRFAGPLTRIETWSIQHLMKQKPGPLKIRERDELNSVATALNKVVSKFDEVETV